MIIIDAQVHIWAPETADKPWNRTDAGKPHRAEPIGCEELLGEMDHAGVHRAILVPPAWEADRNDTSLEAARLYPDRFAVMGRLPLDRPESKERVATWKEQPGMLGIRITLHRGRARSWLEDGTADWFWDAAERYGIPVAAFAPHAVPRLGEVARRHPGLRLIIDHMGLGFGEQARVLGPAVAAVTQLAPIENIAVKASALPAYTGEGYPFRSLHEHIYRVVDAFGPQRVFWGTDFSHMPCTYDEVVRLFTEELRDLSAEQKEWIMGRGIAEWLGWPLPQ
jgi:L-fuconolactonase